MLFWKKSIRLPLKTYPEKEEHLKKDKSQKNQRAEEMQSHHHLFSEINQMTNPDQEKNLLKTEATKI